MTKISKGDFIEVEYTGKVKEDNFVFDTTDEKVAKDSGIHNPKASYGPTIVCIGQNQLLKGLDESLEGKELGKEYTIDLPPEKAFGKKTPQLLKLVPAAAFKKSNTNPEPGMQVEVDGQLGIIKTVTGGRVIVDFNNPLASKELEYKVKPIKVITDDAEKTKAMISLTLGLKKDKIEVSVKDNKVTVKMLKIPETFQKELEKKIKEVVPTIKELVFEEIKEEKAPIKTEKQPLNTSKP